MLWPSASEMLTSERITEQENIAAEDCKDLTEDLDSSKVK